MSDDTMTLNAVDAMLVQNRLLATFPGELRDELRDSWDLVDLSAGDRIFVPGGQVESSLFPLGSTMISMIVELSDGRSAEVATIGREGAVGGIVSCGHIPAFSRAEVMVPGQGVRVPMQLVEQAKQRSGHLRNLLCRYADYLLAQVMQTVVCNSYHPIEARAARWLLTAMDRAGDRLELTQESLAGLLGVQRTTINAVATQLQDAGLLTTRRGVIHVHDRAGLERVACECYEKVENFFGDMVGEGGSGRD